MIESIGGMKKLHEKEEPRENSRTPQSPHGMNRDRIYYPNQQR